MKKGMIGVLILLVLLLTGCTGKDSDRIEVYNKETNKHIQTIKKQKTVDKFVSELKKAEVAEGSGELGGRYRIEVYKNKKKATFNYRSDGNGTVVSLLSLNGDIHDFLPPDYIAKESLTGSNNDVFYLKVALPITEKKSGSSHHHRKRR